MLTVSESTATLVGSAVEAMTELHNCPAWVIMTWIRKINANDIYSTDEYPTRNGVVQFVIGGNPNMIVNVAVKLVKIHTDSLGAEMWLCTAGVLATGNMSGWMWSFDVDIKSGEKLNQNHIGNYPYSHIQL